jgi:hypothetical protein
MRMWSPCRRANNEFAKLHITGVLDKGGAPLALASNRIVGAAISPYRF